MGKFFAVLLLVLLSFACDERDAITGQAPPGGVWTGQVTVHFVANDELQRLCERYENCEPPVLGFAGFDNYGACHVFTMAPKYVDDQNVTTLGHEVLHCIYGKYHR